MRDLECQCPSEQWHVARCWVPMGRQLQARALTEGLSVHRLYPTPYQFTDFVLKILPWWVPFCKTLDLVSLCIIDLVGVLDIYVCIKYLISMSVSNIYFLFYHVNVYLRLFVNHLYCVTLVSDWTLSFCRFTFLYRINDNNNTLNKWKYKGYLTHIIPLHFSRCDNSSDVLSRCHPISPVITN